MKPIEGLPDDGPPCGCVVEMGADGKPVRRFCEAHLPPGFEDCPRMAAESILRSSSSTPDERKAAFAVRRAFNMPAQIVSGGYTLEPAAGVPLLEAHDPATAPVVGKFRAVPTGLPKELPSGEPEVVVFPPRSQGTSKPGRGGRRANQKGRPRKLHDPVSRSFTLERRLVERLEVLASLTGRPVADVCRSALELGVKNLEWGQHDKP